MMSVTKSRIGEGRLARWSRLKQSGPAAETETDAQEGPAAGDQARPRVAPGEAVRPEAGPDTGAAREWEPEDELRPDRELTEDEKKIVESLPAIESLTEGSDFSQFMKDGVPAFLQRQAMRKLWASSSLFGILDGLNDYDEDYTLLTNMGKVMTDYKVGRGFAEPKDFGEEEEQDAPKAAGAEPADAEAADAETGGGNASDEGGEDMDAAKASEREALPERKPQGVTGADVRVPETAGRRGQPAVEIAPLADAGDLADEMDIGDGDEDG